jgi:hypothetical protein
MTSDSKIWTTHRFDENREIRLNLESLQVRITRRGNDLLVVERRRSEEDAEEEQAFPETDFRRYAFEYPVDRVMVSPRTPGRALVVQPAHPLWLASKARVDFYISIPVDIELSASVGKQDQPLERLRSAILSDTWFGDELSGVLCYALKSRARRERSDNERIPPGRALCKLQIHNESEEQLHCTKFCLRLDHCHLWLNQEQLWTSPVRIRFRGQEQMSAVDYSAEAPSEAKGARCVAEAIESPLSGLIRRTFAFAGFGSTNT